MSKPKKSKHKHYPKPRQLKKRGFFGHLISLFKWSIPWVAIFLLSAIMLTLASQMHELKARPPYSSAHKDNLNAAPAPLPNFTVDTEVFAYTGAENKSWQTVSFGQVTKGQEFQFKDHLYTLDSNGSVRLKPDVDVSKLAEADRMFDKDDWRFPEEDDIVRFVDENFNHIRHDRLGMPRPGDRFLFQGQLYEGVAHPDNPDISGYRRTHYVLAPPEEIGLVDAIVDLTLRKGDNNKPYFISGAPQDPYFVPALNSYAPMSDLQPGISFYLNDGPPVTVVSAKIRYGQFWVHTPTYLTPINRPQEKVVVSIPKSEEVALVSSQTPNFIEELVEAQTKNTSPFDLAGQSTQAQAVGQPSWGGVSPTDFGFNGQRQENFGLINYGGRVYNPTLGQFISADPIAPESGNPQALNRYSYAYNNPLKYTDPSGHCVWDGCIVEGAIIGAGLVMAVDYTVQVNNNLNQGMSFGDAVYYPNINTQELGGATLIGAGGGGLTAWAAPAVAPYGYYYGDKLYQFSQTPAGRATGNFAQGAGQACATQNCTPENVIAGGLQDVIMGGLTGDYATGTAFSGAYDAATGNVGVRPSSSDINNVPPGWVYRSGGHGVVAGDMVETYGSNRNNLFGYTITYDAPGELSILSWRSNTLNSQYPNAEPPPEIQTQIIETLKQKTGWNVTGP